MMRRALLMLACVLALAACGPSHNPDRLDPSRGAIFPANKAERLTFRCGVRSVNIEGTWPPTAADIAHLEARLGPVLRAKLKALPFNVQGTAIDVYYRQYGGIVAGGAKYIHINGFREDRVRFMRPDEWRTAAVTVCGGGLGDAWHFTALYDPQSDRIGNFKFSQ